MSFEMEKIRGLKVIALKGGGYRDKRFKDIEVKYILFSDKRTYIELEEQDYYTFHDFSSYARYVNIHSNEEEWKRIFKLDDANEDIC